MLQADKCLNRIFDLFQNNYLQMDSLFVFIHCASCMN
jgi:hypothetical protein